MIFLMAWIYLSVRSTLPLLERALFVALLTTNQVAGLMLWRRARRAQQSTARLERADREDLI